MSQESSEPSVPQPLQPVDADEQQHQQHLHHQQKVFDSMSPWFALRDNQVTPELETVYLDMADDMLTQIIQHINDNNNNPSRKATTATTGPTTTTMAPTTAAPTHTPTPRPRTIRILDVACGTGVLWEFLLKAVQEYNDQQQQRHDSKDTTTTTDDMPWWSLHIDGVDLSPSMVGYATERADQLLQTYNNNHDNNVPQHSIQVMTGDIVQYCQSPKVPMDNYDAIIMNACFGNFYNPRNVLELFSGHGSDATSHTTTTATTTMKGSGGPPLIVLSHPLGATFVQDLHDQDPTTVPHTLPLSPLEMVYKWTFGLPGIVPMAMTKPVPPTSSYYLMILKQLDRATPLPQIQRYRGVVDTGYGRGGKKLGVPTANLPSRLFQDALTTVETGVYFGWAALEHLWREEDDDDDSTSATTTDPRRTHIFPAVVNVGYSPTFQGAENKEKIIEAHLILDDGPTTTTTTTTTPQPLADFYGQVLCLELSGYLRPEKKFDSFSELVAQIHADIQEASLALKGSPYVELRDGSELLLQRHPEQQGTWVGSTGGDATASWEVVDHRDVLRKLL